VFAFGVMWLAKQHNNWTARSLLRRRRGAA
jgi:hypothetical protein